MYEIVHGLICPSFVLCLALLSVCVVTRLSNRHHACASKATQASEEKVIRPSSTDADGISPAESIVKEPMFIAPELLRSMTSMDAFRDDPLMVELFDRFMLWQQHMRPVFAENPTWNPQFISECLSAAVRHILAKHPDRDIAILPHFDLPGPDGKRSPAATEPSASTKEPLDNTTSESIRRVRYAVLHHSNEPTLKGRLLETPNGAMKILSSRKDCSCCIIIEAEEYRTRGVLSFRPEAIAAASTLMSHTSLTDVRTCVTDGLNWMFGRLVLRDGRQIYLDLNPVDIYLSPLFTPPDDILRSRLYRVVGLLACWIDGVAPFIGDAQGGGQ